MDWETRMDDLYELCKAYDAIQHARMVAATHAHGYRQVATLASLALERIDSVRDSRNWVQLHETMQEVGALLEAILLQATERAENLQECADGYADADLERR
jgi:hypothetical protein